MLQVSEALDVWGGLAAGHDAECVFLAILWPVHVLIQRCFESSYTNTLRQHSECLG